MVTYFYLTYRWDTNKYNHCGSNGNERVLHIPQSSSLTNRRSLILYSGHLLEMGLPPCVDLIGVFYSPSQKGSVKFED